MEHTKGEWKAFRNAIGTYTVQTEDTRIGEIDRHFNAYLVAASPDMYEALKEARLQIEYLHDKFKETGTGNAVLAKIDRVIAKDEGKP